MRYVCDKKKIAIPLALPPLVFSSSNRTREMDLFIDNIEIQV
jgi:hypothetical protein